MTPAFERFIAPARAYPQLWRLVLGLALIAGVYLSWMGLIGGLIWLLRGLDALEGGLMRLADGGDPLSLFSALRQRQPVRYSAFVDLDGPLLLARDRSPSLAYEGARVYPPEAALWG